MGPPPAIEHAPSRKNQGGESFTTKGIWTAQGNPHMSEKHLTADSFSKDVLDMLLLLHKKDVRYLIVGGEAVIFHGYARLTGDMDFFYEITSENVRLLYQALLEFWKGKVPGIAAAKELLQVGLVVQFGLPPNRIDLVNQIDGVNFKEAWRNKVIVQLKGPGLDNAFIFYLGREDLIRNKQASGRPKDLDDLRFLESGQNGKDNP